MHLHLHFYLHLAEGQESYRLEFCTKFSRKYFQLKPIRMYVNLTFFYTWYANDSTSSDVIWISETAKERSAVLKQIALATPTPSSTRCLVVVTRDQVSCHQVSSICQLCDRANHQTFKYLIEYDMFCGGDKGDQHACY